MIYVSQIIMLYTLSLGSSVVYQFYLRKTGKEKKEISYE